MASKTHLTSISKPFIVIFESELKVIAANAAEFGEIETGGDLYGLFSHAGRPVISLATPPGPNAIHETAHFQQDVEYTRNTSEHLRNKFAVQFLGNHHSHHSLGLERLSGGDVSSIHSIAHKNGYRSMCQLLVTYKGHTDTVSNRLGFRHSLHENQENFYHSQNQNATYRYVKGIFRKRFTRIYSFFYPDAVTDQPVQCPIKVIPGISPLRSALGKSFQMPEIQRYQSFPISCIKYDDIDFKYPDKKVESPADTEEELFKHIYKKIKYLPEKIKKDIHIKQDKEFSFLYISLPDKFNLVISVKNEPDSKVLAVIMGCVDDRFDPIDISEKVLIYGKYTSISTIYRKALYHYRIFSQETSTDHNNRIKSDEKDFSYKNSMK